MTQDERLKFRYKEVAVSGLLVFLIALAIFFLHLRGWGFAAYQRIRVVNVIIDIFGMVMGYVMYICCIFDTTDLSKNRSCFMLMLLIDFLAMFFDECAWLVDGIEELATVNVLVNTLYYMSTPFLVFVFWHYVITFLGLSDPKVDFWKRIFKIGLIAAVILRIANIFGGFYFKVDADGVYSREFLYPLSLAYAYFTLIGTLVLVLVERKRLQTYQVVIFFMYAVLPFLSGIMTLFFYGLSVSSAVIMLVILLMYCVLNVIQNRERYVAGRELHMAAAIQENVLPRIFPPYPDRKEFDLFASMTPAKEVGGDFYDFFMIDDDHIALVIADVSGKGIPAALFMMVAKTLIKNQTLADCSNTGNIFTQVNNQLCEGNDAEMFVTAWIGILELSTGVIRYSNAGHEDPAICKGNGGFTLHKEKHSLPLAAWEGVKYEEYEIKIDPGDTLYLYTDGVPEATDEDEQLFGTERMIKALNSASDSAAQSLDKKVRDSIKEFVGEAAQFDDITMLGFNYYGDRGENIFTLE